MGLTRPTVAQLNTVITEITDPISVLNRGSSLANIDVGFLFNRDGGTSPNVAVYWNETTKSVTAAYTTSAGAINANISVTSYANLQVGNINSSSVTTTGNVTAQYLFGNASQLTGLPATYGNAQVAAYLPTYSGNIANVRLGVAGVLTFADGTSLNTAPVGTTPFNPGSTLANFSFTSDSVTGSEDEGLVTASSSTNYDLGPVATTGPVFPDAIALPTANTMPIAVQVGQMIFDTANNAPRFSQNAQTFNDPIGYTYVIDDFSSQFDGIATTFTLTVNGGSIYAVNNPNQIMLNIGGINVMPFRRSYYDYHNLPELYNFTSGFVLNAGTRVGNLNLGSGNTIVFSTAPPQGAGMYGTIQTNTDPQPGFKYNQTPFSAINIMLGP
jgi:hypothetical protein